MSHRSPTKKRKYWDLSGSSQNEKKENIAPVLVKFKRLKENEINFIERNKKAMTKPTKKVGKGFAFGIGSAIKNIVTTSAQKLSSYFNTSSKNT